MDTIEKAPLTAADLLPCDLDLTTPLKDLPLSSDFMFAEVMRSERICTLFLESLLNKKIARIEYITKQADLKDDPVSHGIRLDVYLNDENQTRYDIEMQNVRKQSLERRARYYQSGIDRRFLQEGADYDELPESYIIFVCNFDYFRRGLACYKRISSMEDCPGLVYEDGSHVCFLNSGYREANVNPAISEFLDYLRTNDDTMSPRSTLVREVQEALKTARNDPRLEVPYMTYQQKMRDIAIDYTERGRRAGFEEGIVKGIVKGIEKGIEKG
ncbi:MAG: Rpn family recombination-promoting nuclease/putative transposase, partial [Clostridia bacterium]|nr:Rpn family recombination-promoting nuclease/putative transposase [Clostridia bacterium]